MGFSPRRGDTLLHLNVTFGTGVRNFTFIAAEMWGIQPPKLSKFAILPTNLPLRGDSFAQFLLNSQHVYASVGRFKIFNLVAFGEQTIKLPGITIFPRSGHFPTNFQ